MSCAYAFLTVCMISRERDLVRTLICLMVVLSSVNAVDTHLTPLNYLCQNCSPTLKSIPTFVVHYYFLLIFLHRLMWTEMEALIILSLYQLQCT